MAYDDDNETTLVPVFCTVDVPTTVLDTFLTRLATYATPYSFRPRLITPSSDTLAAIDTPSRPPTSTPVTPFTNQSLVDLNTYFVEHIRPLSQFSRSLFIVLDARTLTDETALVVSGGPSFDADDQEETLRTDFYLAVSFAQQAELGVTDLGEGLDRGTVWTVHNTTPFS